MAQAAVAHQTIPEENRNGAGLLIADNLGGPNDTATIVRPKSGKTKNLPVGARGEGKKPLVSAADRLKEELANYRSRNLRVAFSGDSIGDCRGI